MAASQAFRLETGQLDPHQTILLYSNTKDVINSEQDVVAHFQALFTDTWLSFQISLVQTLTITPPLLLLRPRQQNDERGSSWEQLCRRLCDRGQRLGWAANVRGSAACRDLVR